MYLPRYFARADPEGWRVCDHQQKEKLWRPGCVYTGTRPGKPLHSEGLDRETAEVIARGLNEGSIQPEELDDAADR